MKTNLLDHKIVSSILSLFREFIMIIVGIFLALQFDSWVSDKAEIRELNSDLNYVVEDLAHNKSELNTINVQKKESIQTCTALIDAYHQEKEISPDEIVSTLIGILTTNKFEDDQSGFNRIKTSPLYESPAFFRVRDKIREYDAVLMDLRFTENFINAYIARLSLEMSKNGKLLSVFGYMRMKNRIAQYETDLPHFELSEILDDNKPLQAVLHKYEVDAPALLKNYAMLLRIGDELKETIEGHLK